MFFTKADVLLDCDLNWLKNALDVEQEVEYVTVFNDVVFTL
ncbi:hypothetical protein EDC56_1336 [Sinobacterium caligoides]|uniref:Uncharacterized protein n=1 Tax=Sinobacterium caligoides TaxID=933926 RepID=A0A3N2E0Y3_9GAMM|nr:hypothetical protein EDC56_1336 [Sinobacterium caligoides]